MGKTKAQAPVKTVSVSPSSAGSSVGTSTSSSASANSYQNLIRTLLSIPEGASEERTITLNKLATEYKALASSNKLNTLKNKYLAEELLDIQLKYNEAAADYGRTKEEHDALNNKYAKLKQLSQQLSDRTKQSDVKAAAALHAEQQKRVKLTESFSGGIARISSKLESLTTRREAVVTENISLKAVLKSYLEEFDADQGVAVAPENVEGGEETKKGGEENGREKTEQEADQGSVELLASGDAERSQAVGAGEVAVDGEIVTTADKTDSTDNIPVESKPVAEATVQAIDPAVVVAEEQAATAIQAERDAEAANLEAMAAAEDVTRLTQLRATEHELRLKSAKYSQLFDSFQSKLSGCNTGFQSKQASIEALSKEMLSLEKENAVISKRVADCVLSTKVMMKMQSNTMTEAQKQAKVVERYNTLIEILQKEIDAAAAKR